MSELTIQLLGRPRVERDGVALPGPRGFKAWGLLAYLLRAERAPSREQLVSLLFAEADDPLAALRWNLSALRRLLGEHALQGDPVRLALPEGTFVDVVALTSGSWMEALRLPGLERELLAGMSFASSPAFDVWLLTERRHLGATAESVLREAALARLGAGDARAAADLAARLVAMNPFDEAYQVLLVRSLAATGETIAAARQVERCRELFRRELGSEPSAALAAAAQIAPASTIAGPRGGAAAARAQLEAGEAAVKAGALDAGVQCLRRAVVDAREAGDLALQASALVSLGGTLVHAARGRDEEAAVALHEALAVAERAELPSSAAAASSELAYIEILRGRYDGARGWLERAARMAGDDVAERGRIAFLLGMLLTDTAHYDAALEQLDVSLSLSAEAGDGRQVAFTQSMVGRVHLLRGDHAEAATALDASLDGARRENWIALTPWPETMRGDVDLAAGAVDAAAARYEHAFALGCHLGDPCWEAMSARGLGLTAAARGDDEGAVRWLADARVRCVRVPDAYLWIDVYALDALCSLAVERDLPAAPEWIDELARLAARMAMRDFATRAFIYRARLGDPSALPAAQVLAGEIPSPILAGMLETAAPPAGRPAAAATR